MKSVVAGCGLALTIAAASFAVVSSSHAAPASLPILLAQADAPAAPPADAAPAAPAADAVAPAAPAAAHAAAGGVDAFGMPLADGHDLTVAKCSNCHDVTEFSGQRHNADQWGEIIGSMIGRGADINDADFATIQKYLATYMAPAAGAAQ